VFRDGLVRTQLERADLNEENLVEALVGRRATEVARSFADAGNIEERVVLSVSDMRGGPIAGVTLNVRRGEVVGVAGRQGSGRTSLLEMLFGRHKPESGSIALDGERVTFRSPSDAIREGISYVPADRASSASFAGLSIVENYSIARLRHYWRRLVLRPSAELADAESARARYRLKASRLRDPISTLSGGNQQKVILARWLESRPRLVLLDEPTQGIDVGARADIYALVRGDVTQFAGVLLVSSDFEELCLVCDRVVVLEQGKITAEFNRDQLDPEALERAVLMQEATP